MAGLYKKSSRCVFVVTLWPAVEEYRARNYYLVLVLSLFYSLQENEYASTRVRQYASTPVREYASTRVREYASTPVRQYASTGGREYGGAEFLRHIPLQYTSNNINPTHTTRHFLNQIQVK